MQILMTRAAYERVRERLAAIAPGAEVVTAAAPEVYELAGQPIDPDAIDPEVVYLSFDTFRSNLVAPLISRVLHAKSTRWTQVMAAGIDNPMFRAVIEKGVRLSKSSAQAPPIAEYVVGHALSLLLPIEAQAALQRDRQWSMTPYREVATTRWLLIGFGNIGHGIASRIKPFGVHLTVVRSSLAGDPLIDRVASHTDLPQILPEVDVVVLACSLTDETRHLANGAFFAAMKPGAILINIGRGGLVDEDALRAGLDRDQPGRAVLDVFETEPLPPGSWFWDHPKVRVSGHTSNAGDGNLARGDDQFLENLRRYIAGEPLLNEAHPSEVGL